jgi:NAD(P)-dependent dehydrogenase (short-subunit alcohol dehydrogenase family)
MARWTAADIPDLTGRTAIVTGANSGLGFEAASALAEHGAAVVMACRDAGRCATAAARLREHLPSAILEPASLDLADLESVRAFAQDYRASHDSLDILLNNAGVMAPPERATTAQGYELQFGTNHLGHFALTGRLLPLLLETAGSRVITVSSFAHEPGRIRFDDLQSEHDYTPYGAYSASKLANLLFMLELDRRLRAAGMADPISVGAHPGFASTNLQAAGPFMGRSPLSAWLVLAGVRLTGQSPEQGAEPELYAATAPGVRGGDYWGPKGRLRGHPAPSTMARQARDEAVASRLWDVSESLTGVAFAPLLSGIRPADS